MTTTKRAHQTGVAGSTATDPRPTARTRTRRAAAVLGAVAAALAVWAVTVPLAGADLTVRTNGTTGPVGPAAVVASALLAGLAGWALRAVLGRVSRRPGLTWTVVAAVVLVLSLAGPVGSGVDAATKLVLAGMHLAVAAVLIPTLRR